MVCTKVAEKSLWIIISTPVKLAAAQVDFIQCSSSPVTDSFLELLRFCSLTWQLWNFRGNEHDRRPKEGQWMTRGQTKSSRDQTHVQAYSTSKKEEEASYGYLCHRWAPQRHLGQNPYCPVLPGPLSSSVPRYFPHCIRLKKRFCLFLSFNSLLFTKDLPCEEGWFSHINSKLECYCRIIFFASNYWPVWQIFTCL